MEEKMSQPNSHVILLLAHGTPDVLGEMKEYLDKVTGGRAVPDHVVTELQHRYAQIGLAAESGSEPPHLTKWTLKQAALLEDLACTNVYVAMRNWHPYIADVVAQMKADGVGHAKVICLAPQNSRTSIGLYKRALTEAVDDAFTVDFVEGWSDEPKLIAAFAERLAAVYPTACAESGATLPVLFTAHSVPCRTVQGDQPDPYAQEAKRTAAMVAAQSGIAPKDWFFAFQSQGMSGGPWLGPTVEDTLKALKEEGYPGVVIQPIGFVCDHVEVLYDIDIAFQQTARELGFKLWRAESLNDSPLLIEAIASVAASVEVSQPA
jgi:protoporphyrin/coproporphyrin ferrochelatase